MSSWHHQMSHQPFLLFLSSGISHFIPSFIKFRQAPQVEVYIYPHRMQVLQLFIGGKYWFIGLTLYMFIKCKNMCDKMYSLLYIINK